MQYGSRCNLLSGISTRTYKAKCGEPYRNWTRLKHPRLRRGSLISSSFGQKNSARPRAHLVGFFCALCYFLRKWCKGASWAEPCISVIESLLLDNQIFHFSKFKEFPNDENVTKQKPFQRVEMENVRKKIPSDHLLN